MWKMLPLALLCTLTHPSVFVDLQTNNIVTFDKGTRIQIIHIKGDETIVYSKRGYFLIKSDKLECR